jgi:hypothetical protein
MRNGYLVFALLLVFCFFTACIVTITEDSNYKPILNPLDDDPTAVGNFETSKFDGFWQVTNLEIGWSSPAILDYPPMLYIFRANTFQIVAGTRDWSSDIEFGKLTELNISWESNEFMYSDKAIYQPFFREYDFGKWRREWFKNNYEMSADGKNISFKGDQMIKMDVEPWTKENLIGCSWESINIFRSHYLCTFTEDTLLVQSIVDVDGVLGIDWEETITIVLTDESYTYMSHIDDSFFTEHYYIIGDKLILSTGDVLIPYTGEDLIRYVE